MLTILRTLYNNGQNEGNILIRAKDQDFRCHSFVLESTSDYFKSCIKQENFNGIIEIDFPGTITNIVLNFLYSEKIIHADLSADEIIALYNLVSQLRCSLFVHNLTSYYLDQFPNLITEDNWLTLLRYIFNINKYFDLQTIILAFYKNNILNDINTATLQLLLDSFSVLDNEIKMSLFVIALEKIKDLVNEVKCNNDREVQIGNSLNSYLKNVSDEEEDDDGIFDDKKPKKITKTFSTSGAIKKSTKNLKK